MTSITFYDQQGQGPIETFESTTLPQLLLENQRDLSLVLPPVGQPATPWGLDMAITSLQELQTAVAPHTIVSDEGIIEEPESSLSDSELALIRTLSGTTYFTKNDRAYVRHEQLETSQSTEVVGYEDLLRLLAVLKAARNSGAQIQVVSL